MSGDQDEIEPGGSVEWLTMLEAVNCLATTRSVTARAAKESILELMADGQLHLRCQKHFEERDVGPINWRHRGKRVLVVPKASDTSVTPHRPPPSEKRFRPTAIAPSYWLQRDGWSIDPERVDWLSSSIVATKRHLPNASAEAVGPAQRLRRVGNGVEILRDPSFFPFTAVELASRASQQSASLGGGHEQPGHMEPENLVLAPQTSKKGAGGRNPGDDWNDWIAEIVLHIHEKGFDQTASKEKLYDAVRDRLLERGADSPGYFKVEKALGAIKRRMIEYLEDSARETARTSQGITTRDPQAKP